MFSKLTSISNGTAGRLAIVAGAALASSGVVQVLHPHTGKTSEVGDWAGYLTLALFAVTLISIVPAFFALARYGNSPRARLAATAAGAGTVLLATAVVSSIAHGQDYDFFMVVAPLANAGWLFGSIAMAVSLKRAGRVPGAIAIGLPLSWVATLPLAVVGGGVVAGVYWMATGYLLINDGFAPTTSSIASPASA